VSLKFNTSFRRTPIKIEGTLVAVRKSEFLKEYVQ